MVHLALLSPGEFSGAGHLAEAIDAPQNYLGKLLQTLSRAGLLESRKGVGGGFRLARDPGAITLREILEPIEHLDRWEGCFLGMPECSDDEPCAVHDRWGELRAAYLAFLAETTIAGVVERYRNRRGARRVRRRKAR
jgi:Rrf2 family protein